MPTTHYTTRRLPTGKSCNMRWSMIRRNKTKLCLVVSHLTMLNICDKVRFFSCVASCRKLMHIKLFPCWKLFVVSCNVWWVLQTSFKQCMLKAALKKHFQIKMVYIFRGNQTKYLFSL